MLNLFFIYSSIFGKEISFTTPTEIFYMLNSGEKPEPFFFQKNKTILINALNVILPLIAILFLKTSIYKFDKFKDFSMKICDIFVVLLFFILSHKYFTTVINNLVSIETSLINLHSSMYFLNIYFLIICDNI